MNMSREASKIERGPCARGVAEKEDSDRTAYLRDRDLDISFDSAGRAAERNMTESKLEIAG